MSPARVRSPELSLPNVEAPVSALRCETCPCRWGVVSPRQQVSACLGRFRARGELSVESANPLSKMGLAPGGRFGQRPWTVAETSAQEPCLAFPLPAAALSLLSAMLPLSSLPLLPHLCSLSLSFRHPFLVHFSPSVPFPASLLHFLSAAGLLSPPFSLPPSGTGQPSRPVSWAQGQRPQHVGQVGS